MRRQIEREIELGNAARRSQEEAQTGEEEMAERDLRAGLMERCVHCARLWGTVLLRLQHHAVDAIFVPRSGKANTTLARGCISRPGESWCRRARAPIDDLTA